ncbi:hypothetical protein [Streptomyces monomycini]|uniref:hypothetical protein n=1 Tax=Streptomyces monomycini TaxID=371720 RepID=UPI0004AACC86|nr:hypothetical protein [Streptomyces monomycini]
MTEEDRKYARQWLAEHGVTRTADAWRDQRAPGEILTPNEVAHAWADEALSDSGLNASARLRLAFGLLDLLGDYWVTCELRFAVRDERHPVRADQFWDACRGRLEAPEEPEALLHSLWADWFEDRATAEEAFAEVLGNDVDALGAPDDGTAETPGPTMPARAAPSPTTPHVTRPELATPDGAARDALLRRATRALGVSGPVPWPVKHAVYQAAATIPHLHPALFRGLLGSYHDLYGDLDPRAALALLDELDLPATTEHLAPLRAVLTAGHRNHYRAPDAWSRAPDASRSP